ncbi:Hypothetical predicted protein [Cloeon dipterum]|uniref:Peptidase A2 domain-containing protein n=1 Tax=Cloeon dipterum TaxID=197152 RepID=A0A8S1DX70_9INSE|nr:Hypothetical predicted protein [Cloeon dipterum]
MSFSSPALGDLRWAWALKMRIKPWLSQQYSQPSSSGSSHQAEGFSVYGNTYSGVCRGRTSPVDVTFLVDSGAIVSLMSLALVQELRAAIVPFQHNVGTSNGAPIKVKPVVEEEIRKMLNMGVIEPASSEWAAPLLLVKKKKPDETLKYRPVID